MDKIDFTYRKTEYISKHLFDLKVIREALKLLPSVAPQEENLRRKTLLRSSLFSAKIEGNRVKLEELGSLQNLSSENREKREVFNIFRALQFIYSNSCPQDLSEDLILKLHEIVMSDVGLEPGKFRTEVSAIFNSAGVAVYLTPPPGKILHLISGFLDYHQKTGDEGPVKAALSHYSFEKIHPFIDGNGRVGRLLTAFMLKVSGYDFRGINSLEEFIEKRRDDYYFYLAQTKKDITDFVEFFLEGLYEQALLALDKLKNIKELLPEDNLLPRRREILEIVRDQQMVTFDSIRRRFPKVPVSSLHYDLKQLLNHGFVKKVGVTRGSLYAIKDY